MKSWRCALLAGVLAAMILVVAGALLTIRRARGFSASAKPTWMEKEMALMMRRMAMPSNIGGLHDPLPISAANLSMGSQHFAAHCAVCHNNNGDGQPEIGKNLYPKPPDLRVESQVEGDGELFYSIRNGIRLSGMPAWPDDEDSEIWMLVQFIRHLPDQSPAEVDEMKKYNPTTIFPEPIM